LLLVGENDMERPHFRQLRGGEVWTTVFRAYRFSARRDDSKALATNIAGKTYTNRKVNSRGKPTSPIPPTITPSLVVITLLSLTLFKFWWKASSWYPHYIASARFLTHDFIDPLLPSFEREFSRARALMKDVTRDFEERSKVN
jgi:hypothetical protein